ncbi:MAG TPA: amidophosphoribosyltransferase [Verrucomicrobiales bacterium]|nr:amidophosphoribosyltransferase [Verrucomicrobiales bacterium]
MWSTASSWLRAIVGLLYPEVCQFCNEQRASAGEGFVCSTCWSRAGAIRFIRPPFCLRCGLPYDGAITTDFICGNCHGIKLHFTSARSATVAAGLVLEAIHRFKYQRHLWLEPFLADLLLRELKPWLEAHAVDLLVPVPLHPVKRREREFNQSQRIAAAISRATGLPCSASCLKRVRETGTQTALSREQRAINVRKAFAINRSFPLNGKRVLLIDDVFTTGATANACARVLRSAGALDVAVWTVARSV